MSINELDDWETMVIPDLLVREKQILEERKKMEEADAKLTEDLFSDNPKYNILQECVVKKEKPESTKLKCDKLLLENNQRQLSQKIIQNKEEKRRKQEIYGESELDEYDELYGYIEDTFIK